MTTSLVPSSRPISLGTTGDDIDGKTIAESDTGKRESGLDPDQEKPEHHRLANIDAAPDREELKKEGIAQGEDEFPDGGLRAWLVVLGVNHFPFQSGACVTFGTFGFVNAWGVFQAYYQETVLSDTSPSTVAWIGSVQYALVFLPVSIIRTRLRSPYYEDEFLGPFDWKLASGFLFGPTIAVVSHWFRARRGLALGILASGSSIGGTVIPIAHWIHFAIRFDRGHSYLASRLPPKKVSGGLLNLKAFLHIPYSIYVLASVVSFLGLYTVLTYLEVYATEIGLPEDFAFYMIPIANAASLFGRVGSGVVSDRIGPINTLIPSTLVAGVCTYAWPFARNKGSLIVLACIYGAACGVFVGMLATPVAKMGSMDDVGRRTGMLMSVIAAGAVAGPPISGAIRDKTGSFIQVGYYAGSMIILCVLLLICVKFVALGTLRGKF
ncbi:Monocarboxylate [Rhizoctonia solani]|uniref:Monocarboxylate n=1 Tax=Rhizoctonia solani TaxID=456999 RepID=A0A8H7I8V0_9AGAM|nr:Monocarboxylate [Rhizoctonia solani]